MRFNARVPFENASKIVRDAEVADPDLKPRLPDVFWADHLELGTGGTCFARVAAFDSLLSALGFSLPPVLGRVDRTSTMRPSSSTRRRETVIADVGFPLPVLLPAREGVSRPRCTT